MAGVAVEGPSCPNPELCSICFSLCKDPRLLPCLHSMCRQCIDQLSVSEENGCVRCPLCRTLCKLPQNGAAGLPKDFTVIPKDAVNLSCGLCESGSPNVVEFTCEECQVPVCGEHVLTHVRTPVDGGHSLKAFPSSSSKSQSSTANEKQSRSVAAVPLCPKHGQPLCLFCCSCDVSICGHCGTVGDHRGHQPVQYVKDIIDQRKAKTAEQVDELQKKTVTRLERSLQAVDKVCSELEERAEEVSIEIEEAGKRAVEVVEEHVACLLQEVNDMKEGRLKLLHQQRDELKTHLDAAKNVVQFSKRLMGQNKTAGEAGSEAFFSLVQALQSRVAALISMEIMDQPQHHSRLIFQAACHTARSQKAKDSLGYIVPCQASALHSVIEGELSRSIFKGAHVRFTVHAKSGNDDCLTVGGDIIYPRWVESSDMTPPPVSVEDHDKGTYTISCLPDSVGTYRLDVLVNGERMANTLTIVSQEFVWAWDPSECHAQITISDNRQKASVNGSGEGHMSVLGRSPLHHGQYTWKIRIGGNVNYHMLGIATKPLSSERRNDYGSAALCWYNNGDSCYLHSGAQQDGVISWSGNDTFELHLDCDHHTLQIKNLSTGESSTIRNLPVKEYFQFANLFHAGNSVELIK